MSESETKDPRAELIEHAQRLHDTHYELARSDLSVAYEHGREYSERWDVYDYSRAALIATLRRLVPDNSVERAWHVYELMLDDCGEGIQWWLDAEAQQHEWDTHCGEVCYQALRPDGGQFVCTLPRDHRDRTHEAPDEEGCTVLWRED